MMQDIRAVCNGIPIPVHWQAGLYGFFRPGQLHAWCGHRAICVPHGRLDGL